MKRKIVAENLGPGTTGLDNGYSTDNALNRETEQQDGRSLQLAPGYGQEVENSLKEARRHDAADVSSNHARGDVQYTFRLYSISIRWCGAGL